MNVSFLIGWDLNDTPATKCVIGVSGYCECADGTPIWSLHRTEVWIGEDLFVIPKVITYKENEWICVAENPSIESYYEEEYPIKDVMWNVQIPILIKPTTFREICNTPRRAINE